MGAGTWGPYFEALFPPLELSTWISWKMTSTGTNIARRLWDQREELRGEYEDVHGQAVRDARPADQFGRRGIISAGSDAPCR
jgi:hypothetical protein